MDISRLTRRAPHCVSHFAPNTSCPALCPKFKGVSSSQICLKDEILWIIYLPNSVSQNYQARCINIAIFIQQALCKRIGAVPKVLQHVPDVFLKMQMSCLVTCTCIKIWNTLQVRCCSTILKVVTMSSFSFASKYSTTQALIFMALTSWGKSCTWAIKASIAQFPLSSGI